MCHPVIDWIFSFPSFAQCLDRLINQVYALIQKILKPQLSRDQNNPVLTNIKLSHDHFVNTLSLLCYLFS